MSATCLDIGQYVHCSTRVYILLNDPDLQIQCAAHVYLDDLLHEQEQRDKSIFLRVSKSRALTICGIDSSSDINILIDEDEMINITDVLFNEAGEIDLEKILQENKISYSQLESKDYQRVKARKIRVLEKGLIKYRGKYGEFSLEKVDALDGIMRLSRLHLACVRFYPKSCMIDKREVALLSVETASCCVAGEEFLPYCTKGQVLDREGLKGLLHYGILRVVLAPGDNLATGRITYDANQWSAGFSIHLSYKDGEAFNYHRTYYDKQPHPIIDDNYKLMMNFMNKESAEKCRSYEVKAKMMGII